MTKNRAIKEISYMKKFNCKNIIEYKGISFDDIIINKLKYIKTLNYKYL